MTSYSESGYFRVFLLSTQSSKYLSWLDILKKWPERSRESFYYLSLGYYRLGEYPQARKYNEQLLLIEPENQQALSLQSQIEKKVARGMPHVPYLMAI